MSRLIDFMRRGLSLFVILVCAIGLSLSCTQDLGMDADGTDNPSPALPEGMGGFTLSLNPLSAPLRELLDSLGSNTGVDASRAYLQAERFTATLYAEDGTMLDSLSVDSFANSNAGLPMTASFVADPGTYYVGVDIFNSRMSDTSPVLHGDSVPFAVTAGTTSDIAVHCLPVAAFTQSLGYEPIACDLEPYIQNLNTQTYQIGEEAWFSFVATEETTSFVLNINSGLSYTLIRIFDENGESVLDEIIISMWPVITFDCVTQIDKTYYVGALSTQITQGSFTIPASSFSIAREKILCDGFDVIDTGPEVYLRPGTEGSFFLVLAPSASAEVEIDLHPEVTASWNGTPVTGSTVSVDGPGKITLSDGTFNQTIPVNAFVATRLEPGLSWTSATATYPYASYYAVPVRAGKKYILEWNSNRYGNGSFPGFCYVGAHNMADDTEYFTGQHDGYGSNSRTVTATEDGYILLVLDAADNGPQTIGLRVNEKVNRSPVMTSVSSFSKQQTMSSSTSSHYIYYSDPDGDTVTATISCTAAPSGVDTVSVINWSYFESSYNSGYVEVSHNLPAGEYTLTLVLNDGQGYDGSDNNAASRVEIPITMSITNVVPVMALSADETVCAIGATVSLSFSVSQDPDLDSNLLAFSIQSKPEGTAATISASPFTVGTSSITGTATITPDVAGEWVIAVTGTEASGKVSKTVTILVHDGTQGGVEFDVY